VRSFFKNPSRDCRRPPHRGRRPQGFRLRRRLREREARQLPRRASGASAADIVALAAEVKRRVRSRAATSSSKRCAGSASSSPRRACLSRARALDRSARRRAILAAPARRTRVPRPASLTLEEGHRGTSARPRDRLRAAQPEARAESSGATHRRCGASSSSRVLRGGRRRRAGSVHQSVQGQDPGRGDVSRLVLQGHPQHGRDHGAGARTRFGLLDKLEQIAPAGTADPPAGPSDPALREALAACPPSCASASRSLLRQSAARGDARAQDIPVGTVNPGCTAVKRLRRRSSRTDSSTMPDEPHTDSAMPSETR